ncbi:protein-L-isoaspartate(D-aspartate) O-methyltransferase [Chelativorans sp. Marseille-P2723]|uniref:protein-L-isoaspartate(D-aspartate) O-methyltransferase n=1 Tax=Chelativorans sp. Marseille-P2723 TaxID=2709133 RepID=UPI00156E7971|nr:protein-L-isoaspartate(D-aspartate) O-methyltransferase [Chelativorans sp. Marseille-P2723]
MSMGEEEREGFAAFILRMRALGVSSKELLSGFEAIPRSAFIAPEWKNFAWSNRSVPIECGETLEPCDLDGIVIDALGLAPNVRVLEVGTGTGYTAAVMSRLAERVLSFDRYKTLIENASQRHDALGLSNISLRQADGSEGPGEGPFDRIVVWAAFEEAPRRFVEFLTSGGVLVAPVGPGDGVQTMARFVKVGSRFERTDLVPVRLQPLAKGIAQAL